MPVNPFVWFDNKGDKAAETAEFLSKNFGWSVQEMGPLTVLIDGENGPFADTVTPSHGISGWLPYIEVDDLEEAAKKASGNGAEIIEENIDGPAGVATFIKDPGGALIALWKRKNG